MSNILEINNLTYKDIFSNLSFSVEENKFLIISGPNNCGKTTLMKILSGDIKINNSIKLYNEYIDNIKITDYSKYIQLIIPKDILFMEENLLNELLFLAEDDEKEKKNYINFLTKILKLKKVLNKDILKLTEKEIILSQLAIALIRRPQVLLIDNINAYFSKKELTEIIEGLKLYQEKYDLSIIITTMDLELSLSADYIYIISEGKIALEGEPLSVLQKDNIINKIGLALPFMVDLSVKLRDYELIDSIETNLDRMVDKLWN